MSEDRLDDAQTLAVDMAAKFAVNLLLHPLQRTGFLAGNMLQQDVDLTGSFLFDAAQALEPQRTGVAVISMSHKNMVLNLGSGALEPQAFSGRTDAGLLFQVNLKIGRGKAHFGRDFLRTLWFVFVRIRKAGIAGTEPVIGEIAVDLIVFQIVKGVFVAKTAVSQNFCLLGERPVIRLKGLVNLFDYGFQQSVFLSLPKRCR